MGRSVCDEIRKKLLKKLFQFSVSQHKMSKTGDFFEKIEGDVNVMVGFFSNMLIDIMSSSFMIVGILVVFLTKSLILGGIFCVIAVLIFVIFIGTQKSLSALWNDARVSETKLFGEFSEDVYAAADVKGIGKEDYIHERFHKDFAEFEQKQVKASFWGNLPATVFFSLLNVAEGIALLIGVQLLNRGRLSIGELYLVQESVEKRHAVCCSGKVQKSYFMMGMISWTEKRSCQRSRNPGMAVYRFFLVHLRTKKRHSC